MGLSILLFIHFAFSLGGGERIAIFHFNDILGQLQRFQREVDGPIPTPCSSSSQNPSTCVGGIDNLLYNLENRSHVPSDISKIFRLTPGNLVGGENGWLSFIGWEKYGALVGQYYKPTVMSYGLKEFESGLPRTLLYHKASASAGSLGNVRCGGFVGPSAEAEFCQSSAVGPVIRELTPSLGVVGFINPNVVSISSPGALEFDDIVPSLKRVIAGGKMKSYIAMGDGSLEIAKGILDAIPEVKLVIYGRAFSATKNMSSSYPEKYGGDRYIATAGRWGTTLGLLVLDVDEATGAVSVGRESKLIDNSGSDSSTVKEVEEFTNIIKEKNVEVGEAAFELEGGETCWRNECNLGNLVADAMVHCAYNGVNVSQPIVGIWHGGALVKDVVKAKTKIHKLDLHRWLPYHNRAHLVPITGDQLLRLFEESAKGITANASNSPVPDWGQFLQVSNGLEVSYATRGGGGGVPKVDRIRVLHMDNNKPVMKVLDARETYHLVIPSILKEGRVVYNFTKGWWGGVGNDLGFDDDCLEEYIRGLGRVSVGFEERIWIDADHGEEDASGGTKSQSTPVTVILTVIFTVLILGIVFVGWRYVLPKLVRSNNAPQFNNGYEREL